MTPEWLSNGDRRSEWDLTEVCEKDFDQDRVAGDEDRNMDCGIGWAAKRRVVTKLAGTSHNVVSV